MANTDSSKNIIPQSNVQTLEGKYSSRLSDKASKRNPHGFREDESFFRQVLESLDDYAIFTMDLDGNISSWNSGAEKLLGYTEEEAIGLSGIKLFVPADIARKVPQKEMTEAAKKGSSLDERYHVRKDGSQLMVSGKVFALHDEQGKLRGFTKLMRNISHIKVLQETMQQAKEYSESVVETAREPMLVLNGDFTVNTANRAFYKAFRITRKETEGRLVHELGNGQWNIPQLKALLEDILVSSSSFNDFEVNCEFEKIGERTVLLNGRKLRTVGNQTEMVLLAFEDITERKQADQFKNAFIGIASHELRGPVTSIKGYTQILHRRAQKTDNKVAIATLEKINYQTNKLTDLINHLLDVSRIQSGKLQLDKVKFDLNGLMKDIVDDIQNITTTHHIIRQGLEHEEVFADKFRIGQVLTNLISNAVKYSPEANKVLVKLGHDHSKSQCIISVHDYGIGIPETEQKNLFQAFARASNAQKKKIQGVGLGLHISAEIIKEHGGRIWMESQPDQGSIFHVSLPLSR